MINNVTLVGRLTKDPDLRTTGTGTAVTTFTLAVNRRFKNAAGQREADFINCVIWRQSAENLAAWCRKGQLIGITGAIQTRNYEDQQGQRHYVTEVIAEQFQVLEKRESGQQAPQQSPQTPQAPADPFSGGKPMEISDDDLPF